MAGLVVDRYELFEEVASGGMATVFLGRLRGDSGFSRTVAIKRLHAHLARDPEFVAMFLDEARLAARVRHPNVVSTLDVLAHKGELFIIMDYVHGDSLAKVRARLAAEGKKVPLPIVGAIASGILQGLHAAHEARDEQGRPLGIVHRDVSPQNVLVGADGIARVVDFGVAKAEGRLQETSEGQVKGKAAYMAPEQIGGNVDRRTDVFAASAILWELLTGRRLFAADTQAQTLANVLAGRIPAPRSIDPSISEAIEELVLAGLDPIPDRRFSTAREMDQALVRCCPVASTFDVAEWMQATSGDVLEQRTSMVARVESQPRLAETSGLPPEEVTVGFYDPPRRPRRRTAPIVAGTLLIIGGVGAWALRKAPAAPPRAESSQIDATAAAPVAVSPPAPASSSSVSVAPPPARRTPPPRANDTGGRAKPPTKDCDPPYWVDAKGKHFKENCLP